MTLRVIEVTDRTWEKTVEKGEKPAVVMFYSAACPHCRTMEPYFLQYAEEFGEVVTFARLNIDANLWTAERYGVRGTPTFKFFCLGRPVQELVGAVYPALLRRMIEDSLQYGEECARNTTLIDYEITGYA
ncbi:thioredoxin [hydrocarbon metagenome]|uniref:Thioredoxin n=1 Tax=hydrocarbon metagenome TaxID=938273 RepID=A0A0W8FEH4_9ZZZZ|nr:thioredoxin family protein [Methanomicrobiaceae archaeon]